MKQEGVDLEFPGWISAGDSGSAVVLIQVNKWVI
jgi:hypothetical protein